MFAYVLFDLDGTLTDPKEGITKSVQFALRQQGIREPSLDRLEPFIGPPLHDSFMDFYDMTQEQADMAVADYRKRFAPVGIYENKVYPGIPVMLAHLKEAGMKLAVASSKPEKFVIQILEHFKLAAYFDVVVGSGMDGSLGTKEEVVEEALRRLEKQSGKAAGRQKEAGAMVGDRKYDIYGGKEYGLTTVGVSFGYAGKGELEAAGADFIARSVPRLEAFLLGKEPQPKSRIHGRALPGVGGVKERRAEAQAGAQKQGKGTEGSFGDGTFSGRLMKTWDIMMPFVLYYLGSNACYIVIVTLLRLALSERLGFDWMRDNSVGLASLAKACSMLAGMGVLLPLLRREQTKWQPRTEASYPTMGILAAAAALGINIIFGLLRIAAMSVGYYETEKMQYQIAFLPGLVLYGLISPLAEEILFRGMIYNRLKRYFSVLTAQIAAAALFGVYHGNLVQALYGMLMGFLLAYCYEQTGNFRIAVFMHSMANICVFTTTYYPAVGAITGLPVNSIIFLAIAALCLYRICRPQVRASDQGCPGGRQGEKMWKSKS